MVVALGAGDGEAEERGADDLEGIGDDLVAGGGGIDRARGGAVGGHAEKAGGDEPLASLGVLGGGGRVGVAFEGEFVAGELFEQEAVEGQVLVEGADDVVAVFVGVGPRGVVVGVTVRIGIPGDVEPVPGPAFAIAGRGQEFIDQTFVGFGGVVAQELIDFVGGGRQAEEVEVEATDEGGLGGVGREMEAFGFEGTREQGIDGGTEPLGMGE